MPGGARFHQGFARWLGTKGFAATRNDDEIVAKARAEFTETQLIQGFRDALDMVDQKFANYLGSIISSDSYSDVVYRKADGVAWLMLNRPETFNAKRGITMDEMADSLLDAAGDSSIRVVVVSGAGPNGFCTGNDQSYDPELEQSDYRGDAEIRYGPVIQQMPQPVIAAVDGYAIGSGNILPIPATLPWRQPAPGSDRLGREWAAQPTGITWQCWRPGLVRNGRGKSGCCAANTTPSRPRTWDWLTR